MTNLERRALMGDRQAQEECTRRGIVLRCPFCGGSTDDKSGTIFKLARIELYAHKRTGKCVYDGSMIYNLSIWNTRQAPPIGRCGECAKLGKGGLGYGWCGNKTKQFDSFCSDFKPKEE